MAKKREDAFVHMGFDNWKKAIERFNQHTQSNIHKEAILKIELLKQESVHSLLSKQAVAEQKTRRDIFLKQLASLKHLLGQGLAIREHKDVDGNFLQLLMLRSSDCPELKTWVQERQDFSPSILNEQIVLLDLSVLSSFLVDIRSE